MTGQPRIPLDDLTSDALDQLYAERDAARATARRLNYRAQQAESKNAAFERAVRQWDFGERGTYIPHASLRAIGIAAGTDILGSSVRHLKHFQRVEQAEARVAELEAEVHRYEEVVVGDLNEANTGLQRQAARAEVRVRNLEAERTNLLSVLTEAVDWIRDGDLRDRMLDAITPPRPATLCGCGRPDPGPCNPCPDNTPSLHCACDCTPTPGAT